MADFKQFFDGFENSFQHLFQDSMTKLPVQPMLDQYIQDVIAKATPDRTGAATAGTFKNNHINVKLFETHNSVIARFTVSPSTDPRSVRIFIGTKELMIRCLEDVEKKYTLPHKVRLNGCTAGFKDGIFEVRMPKETDEEIYKELNVKYYGKS